MKIWIPILIFAFTASCSEKNASNDQRQQQAQEMERLEKELANVVGVYEGKVTFTQAPSPAPSGGKLSMYIIYVQDGINPDGSVRVRPTLHGRFVLEDYILETDRLILGGTYNALSGDLVMTADSKSGGSGSSQPGTQPLVAATQLSLAGKASPDWVKLTISNNKGVWANFDAKLTSRVTSTGASVEADERARRTRILNKIVGTYTGLFKNINPSYNFKCGDIKLILVNEQTELGLMPTLGGSFEFTRLTISHWGMRNIKVEWDGMTGDLSIKNASGLYLNGRGTLINGQLAVSLEDTRGYLADLTATQGQEPAICTRERLDAQ